MLAIAKWYEYAALSIAGGKKTLNYPVALGYIGVSIPIDERYYAIIAIEASELIGDRTIHTLFVANRLAHTFIKRVLYWHSVARDSEAVSQQLGFKFTDIVAVAPFNAVHFIIAITCLASQLA